ncbi:hypothetical protein [Streptomyces cinereospinus]|uniref:Uncharacterized protein n=1 Tax=Streptomyces cinereospinus TaxID=285561 RepID=A0ABV5N1M4_9ACTN
MSEPPRTGESQGPPFVYQPQLRPDQIPAYEEYADPAAAHGWQNAYDETRELPPVAPPGPRRSRRKPGSWRQRRVAVAAGAVGAVGAAALIAGFSFSGSSSGGAVQGERERTSPAADDPGPVTPSRAATDDGGGPATAPAAASSPAPGTSAAAPGPSASGGTASSAPTAEASTTAPPPAPAATGTLAGDGSGDGDGHPGRGHGGDKRPR